MARRPLIVLADDLTGAAEVAAIAHRVGLRAVVFTQKPRGPVDADLLIFDTDTRLATPAQAARRVRALIACLPPHAGLFKKTDSVLRGPVLAELAACSVALGFRRTLLVPANPSLGRVIHAGRYFIAGTPLEETTFARDPHHPRTTSVVLDLLGADRNFPASCAAAGGRLPSTGVFVGEAAAAAAIAHWARTVDRHTLAAGAADFFRAWLATRVTARPAARDYRLPDGAALLLHGSTTAPACSRLLLFRGCRPPAPDKVAARLRRHGAAAVATARSLSSNPRTPAAISRGFAGLARHLRDVGAFHHLLIAGGATAAAVLCALGWSGLKVVRVWAPGVVTLQPANAPGFAVTLKPGSYPWPASLRRFLPRALRS
jgi:uncharacterized protein YgbK (DUF1537 family)